MILRKEIFLQKVGLNITKILIALFFVFCFSKNVSALEFKGKFIQGNFILGKANKNTKVKIDNKFIRVNKNGYFAFGLSKNRKNDIVIEIIDNGKSRKITKKIYKKKYIVQKIDGLAKKHVTPPKEVYERIKQDNKLISKARSVDSSLDFFTKDFIKPVENSIITGVYGSQRILNGIPKSPHFGLDFAGKEGTKVKAMLDGIVTMSEQDLYYTGGTIIFDHGHGVSTLYMHMKDIFVKKNQEIKQGEIIGTIGKTGRATGPHLDIRLNWFDIKLDPASVL
jgi:murein DD-endopeptidase MepM/ murein hydrolase activator NlpD